MLILFPTYQQIALVCCLFFVVCFSFTIWYICFYGSSTMIVSNWRLWRNLASSGAVQWHESAQLHGCRWRLVSLIPLQWASKGLAARSLCGSSINGSLSTRNQKLYGRQNSHLNFKSSVTSPPHKFHISIQKALKTFHTGPIDAAPCLSRREPEKLVPRVV